MTKRGDIVRMLLAAGFKPDKGTRHEKYIHPDGRQTVVPRHNEVPERIVRMIEKEAGVSVLQVVKGERGR